MYRFKDFIECLTATMNDNHQYDKENRPPTVRRRQQLCRTLRKIFTHPSCHQPQNNNNNSPAPPTPDDDAESCTATADGVLHPSNIGRDAVETAAAAAAVTSELTTPVSSVCSAVAISTVAPPDGPNQLPVAILKPQDVGASETLQITVCRTVSGSIGVTVHNSRTASTSVTCPPVSSPYDVTNDVTGASLLTSRNATGDVSKTRRGSAGVDRHIHSNITTGVDCSGGGSNNNISSHRCACCSCQRQHHPSCHVDPPSTNHYDVEEVGFTHRRRRRRRQLKTVEEDSTVHMEDLTFPVGVSSNSIVSSGTEVDLDELSSLTDDQVQQHLRRCRQTVRRRPQQLEHSGRKKRRTATATVSAESTTTEQLCQCRSGRSRLTLIDSGNGTGSQSVVEEELRQSLTNTVLVRHERLQLPRSSRTVSESTTTTTSTSGVESDDVVDSRLDRGFVEETRETSTSDVDHGRCDAANDIGVPCWANYYKWDPCMSPIADTREALLDVPDDTATTRRGGYWDWNAVVSPPSTFRHRRAPAEPARHVSSAIGQRNESSAATATSHTSRTASAAAVQRVVRCEEAFVRLVSVGCELYSRPLRHDSQLLPADQWSTLFQNIEKLAALSEFNLQQLRHAMTEANHRPASVGVIYQSKLKLLVESYRQYHNGLTAALRVGNQLRYRTDFVSRFEMLSNSQDLTLEQFLTQPVEHFEKLCQCIKSLATISNNQLLQQIAKEMSSERRLWNKYI